MSISHHKRQSSLRQQAEEIFLQRKNKAGAQLRTDDPDYIRELELKNIELGLTRDILSESEQNFRNMFADNPQPMWIYDLETLAFLEVNDAAIYHYGYSKEEFLAKTLKDIRPKEDIERLLKDIELTRKSYNPAGEWRHIKKNGEIIHVEIISHTVTFKGRKARHVMVKDITKRKIAEESFRQSEEKYRLVSDNSDDWIYWKTPEGNFKYLSPACEHITGYSILEFEKDPALFDEIIFDADKELVRLHTNTPQLENTPHNIEFRIKTKSGEIRWISHSCSRILGPEGEYLGRRGTNRDITKQKQAEEKIRQKDQEFRKLSANVPDLIFQFTRRTDGSYCVPIASEGIRNIFGCTPEEVLDDFGPIGRVIYPEDAERVIREIEYSAEHLCHFTCEFRVLIPGREIQWIYSNSSPEKLPDGSVTWYGFNVDFTRRKKAEEEVRKLNETLELRVKERTAQLQEANQELEAFSYSISHDLRAPLRHINGFVDLLSEKYQELLPEKGKHYLKTIVDSSNHMGNLIDDLLQFSRTGRQEMQQTNLDMNLVLEETMFLLKPDTEERTIEWEISELPHLKGDHAMLRQVLFNLLSNAIKFTRLKEKAVIRVGCHQEADEYIFSVRDNGSGFDMRYANKLFGVFQRLHSNQEFEGTGIGLANVRLIISKHGGRAWAESQLGQGANFYFTIPKNPNDKK